ncbi:YkgJ family cysteine cluster protein [Candidatus Woesearchaeota archaeon]|nr:YkgJ family cysteine cluster protein [Candidatus Woesearchaeota archaeon]
MRAETIRTRCRECEASCCRLGGVDVTGRERTRILAAGHPNFFVRIGPDHYEMRSVRGVCPYLTEDHECSIHAVRPLMCECWPVDVELVEGKREYVVNACPIAALFDEEELQASKERLADVPERILAAGMRDSQLPAEDLDLIEMRSARFRSRRL